MKKSLLILAFCCFRLLSDAQLVVDSCFSSPLIGTTFLSTADLANADEADLINWNGTSWQGGFANANISAPPPCTGINQRAIFTGDDTQWTTGGEGFALRLDSALIAGQTYSFTFTYISDGVFSNGAFSPSFSTNNAGVYAGAYLSGYLTPAGFSWLTSTYTFTATAAQNNHNWIIIHSNSGSGLTLNKCSGSAVNISLASDTTICSGDSILVDAGSGFSGYQWSTGSTSQSIYVSDSGTYVVTVSNVCGSGTDSVVVHLSSCTPDIAFSSSDTSFCDNHCIDFTDLSTNNPTSWQWIFPGADSTSSALQNPANICYNSYGSFDVTLIACNGGGCDTLYLPGFINEFQPPATPVVTVNIDTLFSSPAFSYQWYFNSIAIPGATNQYYVYPQQGSYYVIISDSSGCASSSNVINTGIAEPNNSMNEIQVFPNPSEGNFEIYFGGNLIENGLCQITDVTGRLIFMSPVKSRNLIVNINGAANGIYLLTLKTGNKIFNKKIVLNHVIR